MNTHILNLLKERKAANSLSEGDVMDYDWKYHMEDLKAGKAGARPTPEEREAAEAVLFRLPDDRKERIRSLVKGMLLNYRHQEGGDNGMVRDIMAAHAEYCRLLPGNELPRRRHNAVVYRYMMETARHNRAVAAKMAVSVKTVHNDIHQAIDEMAVLCFGLPVSREEPGTWQEGMKSLLCNFLLLEKSKSISRPLIWSNWQQKREKCLEITDRAFRCLERAVCMYEEFIAGISFPDMQKRALEIVKEVYFEGIGIAEAGDMHRISEATVYSDINKVTERFGELAAFMAGNQEGNERRK